MVSVTMKELLEAGVHFGHQTKRWNPKMKEFIFGQRNGIYIIDLQKTMKVFKEAISYVREVAEKGQDILLPLIVSNVGEVDKAAVKRSPVSLSGSGSK